MRKIIAFGDIHGCFKAAARAVQLAEENSAQAIFLGDYVDRGPSAIQTLRILNEAKKKHNDWIFLRGNHDQMLLDLINKKALITDVGKVFNMNFDYNQTAKSYEEWRKTSKKEQIELTEFLNSTYHYYETEHFIFCHAVLRNTEETMDAKSGDELIWNYNYEPNWEIKRFIHGHLPVEQPSYAKNGININTKCGYGGVLTGIIINGEGTIEPDSFLHIAEDGNLKL